MTKGKEVILAFKFTKTRKQVKFYQKRSCEDNKPMDLRPNKSFYTSIV